MRVTIIPSDKWIRRDDVAVNLAEWSFDDSDIHAIQWYENYGEIEYTGHPKPANKKITDDLLLLPYLEALDNHLKKLI